jgi:hypothetical protein
MTLSVATHPLAQQEFQNSGALLRGLTREAVGVSPGAALLGDSTVAFPRTFMVKDPHATDTAPAESVRRVPVANATPLDAYSDAVSHPAGTTHAAVVHIETRDADGRAAAASGMRRQRFRHRP